MKITIFTATYNRATLLPRLYESIKLQQNHEFEWLIVDDGSTDDTKGLVDGWKKQSDFSIEYVYQNNRGKWKAFNNAIKLAKGELFFCVDSDDWLTPNALNCILQLWEKRTKYMSFTEGDKELGGIIARKQDHRGNMLSKQFPLNVRIIDTFTLTEKYKCLGEFALIYKTEILRRFPFPELREKFITECVIYDQIAEVAQLMILDEVVNQCEYQSDGLSGNVYKLMINNPTGYQIYYLQRVFMCKDVKNVFANLLRYHAFRKISKNDNFKYIGKHRFVNFVANLLGTGLQYYYKMKVIQENKGE